MLQFDERSAQCLHTPASKAEIRYSLATIADRREERLIWQSGYSRRPARPKAVLRSCIKIELIETNVGRWFALQPIQLPYLELRRIALLTVCLEA